MVIRDDSHGAVEVIVVVKVGLFVAEFGMMWDERRLLPDRARVRYYSDASCDFARAKSTKNPSSVEATSYATSEVVLDCMQK